MLKACPPLPRPLARKAPMSDYHPALALAQEAKTEALRLIATETSHLAKAKAAGLLLLAAEGFAKASCQDPCCDTPELHAEADVAKHYAEALARSAFQQAHRHHTEALAR